MKEHFNNFEIIISEIYKTENYKVLAPSNIHCFNKIMKDWPEDIELEVFEKDMGPILCVNKIPESMEIETVKIVIVVYIRKMSIDLKGKTETQQL